MKEFSIPSTKSTPEVFLSPDGVIRIKGRSIHENIAEIFIPVEEWINEYLKQPADITIVEMYVEYFNSASAKVFIHLLQKITYVAMKHKKFEFKWYYEVGDEDILERGEYFSSILGVPFSFIKVK